jgi:Fur family zinc uptake transcriptional regulator
MVDVAMLENAAGSRCAGPARDPGAPLTPLRHAVLRCLEGAGGPVGAYELFGRLRCRHPRLQPSSVYRVLDYLEGRGLVLRLAGLRAYIALGAASTGPAVVFVCHRCKSVRMQHGEAVAALLAAHAAAAGFRTRGGAIEVGGLCQACARGADPCGRRHFLANEPL